MLGGLAGAVLLLTTPAEGFEKAVPLLLGLASLTILLPAWPRGTRVDEAAPGHAHGPPASAGSGS